MLTKIFASFVLTLFLVLPASNNLKADFCDYPYERNGVILTYPLTNCRILVEWCCLILEDGTTSYRNVTVTSADEDDHCISLINPNALMQWAYDYIMNVVGSNVCSSVFPPCDDEGYPQYLQIEFTTQMCYKLRNFRSGGIAPNYTYLLRLEPCIGFTQCQTVYEVCYDYFLGEIRRTPISQEILPGATCSSGIPQAPPAGKTFNQPWVTDCFTIGCP